MTNDSKTLLDSCIIQDAVDAIDCNNASPSIKNSTIKNNQNGIIANQNSGPIILNNSFSNITGEIISMYAAQIDSNISGLTISNNTNNYIYVRGDRLSEYGRTYDWLDPGLPYRMVSHLNVYDSNGNENDENDATVLKIYPGTTVQFNENKYLKIGGDGNERGALDARGVTFTAVDTAKVWAGIDIYDGAIDSTVIDSNIIEYANRAFEMHSGITPLIKNNTIRYITDYGIYSHGHGRNTRITGNTFLENNDIASFRVVDLDSTFYSNTYTDNTNNYIMVRGDRLSEYGRTYDWLDPGLPYRMDSHLNVYDDDGNQNDEDDATVLKIYPGTTVRFNENKYLSIGNNSNDRGALDAQGAIFTSTGQNKWRGIEMLDGTAITPSKIINTVIEKANIGLRVNTNNSLPLISKSTFRFNQKGFKIDNIYDSTAAIGGSDSRTNTFYNNEIAGINNATDTTNSSTNYSLIATYNNWGDKNGPRHKDNPGGKGDSIIGKVNYYPWRIAQAVESFKLIPGLFGITLEWTPSSTQNVIKYNIYRSLDSTAPVLYDSVDANIHVYLDNDVVRGSEYFYWVAPVDADGEGMFSSVISGSIATFDLVLSYPDRGEDSLNVVWKAHVDTSVAQYYIYAGSHRDSTVLLDSLSGDSTRFIYKNLEEAKLYFFKFRARNAERSYTTFTIIDSAYTNLIAPINLLSNSINKNQINLTWKDSTSKEDGYKIEQTVAGINNWNEVDSVAKDEQAVIRFNLEPATAYSFRVRAYTKAGAFSNYSNTVTDTTERDPNIPYGSIIDVAGLEGIKSDTISIQYELKLDTGNDSKTINWGYSLDGTEWVDIGENEILNNDLRAPGDHQIEWLTLMSLDGIDDETVWFRMKYTDNTYTSSFIYSNVFHLDNNLPPNVSILPVVGEQLGNVNIEYTAQDEESDTISFDGHFWVQGDTLWSEATIDYDSTNITWKALSDIRAGFEDSVLFRVTPKDKDKGNVSNEIKILLDYNQLPTVKISTISSPQASSVPIGYTITDQESDTIRLEVNYNLGFGWKQATIKENIDTITTYSNILTWSSMEDLDPILYPTVQIQIIPYDKDLGVSATSNDFQLDNDQLPKADVIAVNGEQSNDIQIIYVLSDKQKDNISFIPEYSVDRSVSWSEATIVGEKNNIIMSDTSKSDTLVWQSFVDLPEIDVDSLYFRIVPNDFNGTGFSRSTAIFHLDNNTPPKIILSGLTGEQSDAITVAYQIIDISGLDNIELSGQFSSNQGATWSSAVFPINTKSIGPSAYTGSFVWDSKAQTEGIDENDFQLIVKPSDLDPGTADTIVFHLDNEVGPVLLNFNNKFTPVPADPLRLEFSRSIERSSVLGAIQVLSDISGDLNDLNFTYENNDKIINVFSANGIPAMDRLTVTIENELKDTAGKGFDGNQNGDPEYTTIDDTTFVVETYLGADFDQSGKIGQNDISIFVDAWSSDNFDYEIGPTIGVLPNLRSKPDQQYNIDDFMTFIRYWNWAKSNNMVGRIITGVFDDQNINIISKDNKIFFQQLTSIAITDFHISIQQYGPMIQFLEPKIKKETNGDADKVLMVSAIDTSMQYYDVFMGFLKPSDSMTKDSNLIQIPLKIRGRDKQNVEILYEYNMGGHHYTGQRLIEVEPIPETYELGQNFPNPFNPITTIFYDLPVDGKIELSVYDMLGREVVTLVNGFQEKGYKTTQWKGFDRNGVKVSTGIYFYRLISGDYMATKKMILLK